MADSWNDREDDGTRIVSGIRKLANDKQWETWKWQIELCLKELCLYTIVDGSRVCPAAPVGNAKPSAEYRNWQRDNARAARIIGTALDEEAAIYVRRKTDAKEIWETLLSVFQQSSLQRLYTLFDNFFEMTKDDVTSVTKHTSQLANVFDDILAELRKNNPNAELPLSLLHHRIFKTLGSDYQYYRATWYRVPEAEQTTKLLVENLRSIENSLLEGTTQVSGAFHASSGSQKQQNRQKLALSSSQASSKEREKRSCLYCKKVGHIIANCRKRIAAEQKPGRSKVNNAEVNCKVGLAANADFAAADSWVSDSGTTNHMTTNKHNFANFEKFSIPRIIHTVGKDVILAYGSGKINIKARVDGKWIPGTLNDVWYVPEARHQLFSIPQAVKRGNTAMFNDNGVEIRKHGELVATGKLVGSMYIMDIRVSKHRLVKTRDVDFRPEKLCTSSNTIFLESRHPNGNSFRDEDIPGRGIT